MRKKMTFLTLLTTIVVSFNCFAYKIYDTKTQNYINKYQFLRQISRNDHFVLGEFHYDSVIQNTEAEVIKDIVLSKDMRGHFSIAWEFLNFTDQKKIRSLMSHYKKNKIKALDIIKEFFPGEKNTEMNKTYIPLFQTAKNLNGQFIGTNAPRNWKSVITKKGIAYLEKNKIPENMSEGSKQYLKRFTSVMRGHVDGEQLAKYFTAQSYTDSVISTSIRNFSENDLTFLIIGAFHSDFNDGIIPKLNKLHGDDPRFNSSLEITLKIINSNDLDSTQMQTYLKGSKEFGQFSRYIILSDK